jgi:hypothetical protein
LVPALAIVLVAAALVVVGVLFAGTDVGRDLFRADDGGDGGASEAAPPAAIELASVSAFDPLGDASEHDDDAALVTDGNPTTVWTTSNYRSADFGGLKTGVGLVAVLPETAAVRRIEVESAAPGWRAEVYLAPEASTAFPGGWGQPVATLEGSRELVAADLPEHAQGRAVLLWLTSLSPDGGGYRGIVGELRVLA